MLKLINISAKIAGITVLRHIQAEFKAGSLVAVVGRNGAGKTTLLRSIMGLIALEEGQIEFNGQDLKQVPDYRRAAMGIGYAPEERVMFPTFTVEENLRLPCEVQNMPKHDINQRLEMTLQVVPQLKEMLPRSGAALSGGQGKMAALGRALMAGSHVVLLDEPFQGLAPVLSNQYAESLRRLREINPQLSIIITESNGSLLRNLPDMTLILERGELISSPHAIVQHLH